MNLVDRAFKLWEKQHQPRRAKARTVTCSNSVDCEQLMQKALDEKNREFVKRSDDK